MLRAPQPGFEPATWGIPRQALFLGATEAALNFGERRGRVKRKYSNGYVNYLPTCLQLIFVWVFLLVPCRTLAWQPISEYRGSATGTGEDRRSVPAESSAHSSFTSTTGSGETSRLDGAASLIASSTSCVCIKIWCHQNMQCIIF